MLYAKIAIRNILRSKKDNAIYFFTIVFCSSIFFAFNDLDNLRYFSNSIEFQDLSKFLIPVFKNIRIISNLTGIPIIFLIIYINAFILRRRSKEYSLYIVLGISKAKMNFMVFTENFITGIFSVLTGCFIGRIISTVLKCYIVQSLEYPLEISWDKILQFDIAAITDVILFFGVQFFIVGILNIINLSKRNFTEIMQLENKREKIKFKRKFSKNWIAVLIVTIIAYILIINKSIKESSFINIVLSGTIGIILIVVFYSTLHSMFLEKRKFLKKKLGLFMLNELENSMKTQFRIFEILTLIAVISLSAIAACNVLEEWGKHNITIANAYDIQITAEYASNSELVTNKEMEKIEKFISKDNTISYKKMTQVYMAQVFNNNIGIISLSDFNDMRLSKGYEKISLNEDQFLIYQSKFRSSSDDNALVTRLITDGLNINRKKRNMKSVVYDSLGNSFLENKRGISLVLSDYDLNNLKPHRVAILFDIEDEMKLNFTSKLSLYIDEILYQNCNLANKQIDCQTYIEMNATERLGGLTVKLVSIYLGLFFAIIYSTMIMIQNLSQLIQNQKKYKVLYRLGMDIGEIFRKVSFLCFLQYFVPVFLAVVMQNIIYFIWGHSKREHVRELYSNMGYIYNTTLFPILLFGMIIAAYYLFTILWSIKQITSIAHKSS